MPKLKFTIWQDSSLKMTKLITFANFNELLSIQNVNIARFARKSGRTVLPDGSVLMGQKLMENAKIKVYNLTGQIIKNDKIDQFCEFL